MSSFTKGPWTAHVDHALGTAWFSNADGGCIAYVEMGGAIPDHVLRDHALCAAAPDLYAVVEAAVEQWGALEPSSLRLWEANLLVVARAALAKARGES